jgi:hypothetical protein
VTSGRDAAELLARLAATRDATTLVRELAGADCATGDDALGTAITSAPAVLAALENVEWSLLDSVCGFAGRGDPVGNRAEGLLDEIATTAVDTEFNRALAPVLNGVRQRAVALVNDAARLAAVTIPAPAPPRPPSLGRPFVPRAVGPPSSRQPSTGRSRRRNVSGPIPWTTTWREPSPGCVNSRPATQTSSLS